MSDENKGRAVLGMVARDAVQAVASSSLIWPAAGPAPNGEAAEGAREVTAEQVVNALEGVYGVNRGKRRNHTKGFGALGSFVGAPEAAAYSRSALFSEHEIEVVARFSVAGGDPEASDSERSARGLGLEFRLPGGGLHHITMLHTPMFFATIPKIPRAKAGSCDRQTRP